MGLLSALFWQPIRERDAKIASLMAADPTLKYSVTTNRFYRIVSGTYSWQSATTAIADPNTASSVLNGVNGYMATVRTANDNMIVWQLAASQGTDVWIGASDATTEGVWQWYDGSVPAEQFWSGLYTGSAYGGNYSNWNANEPNNYNANNEDYAELFASTGKWNDLPAANASLGYVVEWAADDVLDTTNALTYSIVSQTLSGAFAVNSDNGTITVANSSLLDYEFTTSQTVTVRVTDSGGLSYDKTLTISLTNVNEAPTITSNGAGATASVSVAENQTAVTTVTSTDQDAGATATYSISGGADSS